MCYILSSPHGATSHNRTKLLLSVSVHCICSPLTHISNKSISTGIFPEKLKYSIMKTLFKKGGRTTPSNYRPISLLTAFSKVTEKALYNRLIDHININSLLNSQQYGFRSNLSTDNAIFNLTHENLKALNSKMTLGSIFFDLEKAFDSINHSLLINKLPQYGILGKSKLFIESYLTSRFQRVQLDSHLSDAKLDSTGMKVKHGAHRDRFGPTSIHIIYQ